MITDIHTHIYTEKIYKSYLSKATQTINKILVMAQYEDDLKKLLSFTVKKDNLYVVGSVDIEKNIGKQLNLLREFFQEKKIYGIKLYPGYQYFYASDKRMDLIARFCQEYNRPLILHSGDVYDIDNRAILKYSHPIYVDELANRNPKCKIVVSHFGFPYFLEAANVVSKNKNVYTDISGVIDDKSFSLSEKKALFTQYIDDLTRVFSYFPDIKKKVMFGTDYSGEKTSLNEIDPYIAIVKHIFSKEEQKNVFYKLADELFFH